MTINVQANYPPHPCSRNRHRVRRDYRGRAAHNWHHFLDAFVWVSSVSLPELLLRLRSASRQACGHARFGWGGVCRTWLPRCAAQSRRLRRGAARLRAQQVCGVKTCFLKSVQVPRSLSRRRLLGGVGGWRGPGWTPKQALFANAAKAAHHTQFTHTPRCTSR